MIVPAGSNSDSRKLLAVEDAIPTDRVLDLSSWMWSEDKPGKGTRKGGTRTRERPDIQGHLSFQIFGENSTWYYRERDVGKPPRAEEFRDLPEECLRSLLSGLEFADTASEDFVQDFEGLPGSFCSLMIGSPNGVPTYKAVFLGCDWGTIAGWASKEIPKDYKCYGTEYEMAVFGHMPFALVWLDLVNDWRKRTGR